MAEIDPQVTAAAKQYFGLQDDPRIKTTNEDGRVFLDRTKNKYDAIFLDTFKTHMVPYQLTTKEAVQKMYNSLNDRGVVMANLISAIAGDKGKFFQAEYATYKKIFPQVLVFRVQYPQADKEQNLILVGLKSTEPASLTDSDRELSQYLGHIWSQPLPETANILTDDFAPVDQYLLPTYTYNRLAL